MHPSGAKEKRESCSPGGRLLGLLANTVEVEVSRYRVFVDGNDPSMSEWHDLMNTGIILSSTNESCTVRGRTVSIRRVNMVNRTLDQLHGTPMDMRGYTYAWNRSVQMFQRLRDIGGVFYDSVYENPAEYTQYESFMEEMPFEMVSENNPIFYGNGFVSIGYNASNVTGGQMMHKLVQMDAEPLDSSFFDRDRTFCVCYPPGDYECEEDS